MWSLQLVAKQKNMLSGFFKKDATSPAPADVLSSPDKASEQSDFDKVFFPFTVRQGVTVAPVNRFSEEREKKKVKLSKIDVNTDATLTKKREHKSHVSACHDYVANSMQ